MPSGRLLGIMCLVGVVPRGHYRLAGSPRKSLSSGIKTFRRLGGEVASPPPPPPPRTPRPPLPTYSCHPATLLLLPTSLILLLLPSSLLLLLMLLVIAALFLDLATSLLFLLFVLFFICCLSSTYSSCSSGLLITLYSRHFTSWTSQRSVHSFLLNCATPNVFIIRLLMLLCRLTMPLSFCSSFLYGPL